jgi:uncharacterized Zn-binding protein involved in type VI secretion
MPQAARLGDQTSHGGSITSGFPTVLIEGLAAAREFDTHVCPLFDGPKPHGGGVVFSGSPTVYIGGFKAARVGDPVGCSSPMINTIAKGAMTVLIGP